MDISDILTRERILCNVNLASKKAALETLAALIADTADTADADIAGGGVTGQQVFDSLLSRERLGGTGLGNGIALPHGRLKNSSSTIAAFIKLKRGVDYDATDRQPVDLMFALVVPEHSTEEHLQVLSQLAERFDRPEFLARLRAGKSNDTIYELLTSGITC